MPRRWRLEVEERQFVFGRPDVAPDRDALVAAMSGLERLHAAAVEAWRETEGDQPLERNLG